MKKTTQLLLFYCFAARTVFGQIEMTAHQLDSLDQLLEKATADSIKFDLHMLLAMGHQLTDQNRALREYNTAIGIARKMDSKLRIAGAAITLGYMYTTIGDHAKAIEMNQEALRITEQIKDEDTSMPLAFLSESYEALGDFPNAFEYARKSFWVYEKRWKNGLAVDQRGYPASPLRLGTLFEKSGQLDSAMFYSKMAYDRVLEKPSAEAMPYFYVIICNLMGKVHSRSKSPEAASRFFRLAINKATELNYPVSIEESQLALAQFYHSQQQKPDSVILLASSAYAIAKTLKHFSGMHQSAALLRSVYERKGVFEKALFYNDLAIAARDSVSGAEKVREVQQLTNREEQRQLKIEQAAEAAELAYRNKIRFFALSAVLAGLLFLAFILFRNNRQKQKANALLEKTLLDLKSTQNQLIQSEKLASLGELTAGIAHEIQNPLNFVNNFSELSIDIAEDLKLELEKAAPDQSFIDELINDLSQNQQKINHHGKRAASIVSGMLLHSRTSSGQKELTDLNALADEFLRLSYHGLRAKDSSFNAKIETAFDPKIGKIEVIPQDMGRVFLNLMNNAFYAAAHRKKTTNEPFEPTVWVSTFLKKGAVEIRVRDNGNGIPEDVKAKIFQPFFTTKPTGEGTGLGLSLAYDIVKKGHGGSLEVISEVGKGTEFLIVLPVKNME